MGLSSRDRKSKRVGMRVRGSYSKEMGNQGVRGHRAKCNGTRGLGGVRGVE